MINKIRAQQIAGQWHGGQWSALYQFASSGIVTVENSLQYQKEIFHEIEIEYFRALIPFRSVKDKRELMSLSNYLIRECREIFVYIELLPDQVYGYTIPYCSDRTSLSITPNVKPVYYLR